MPYADVAFAAVVRGENANLRVARVVRIEIARVMDDHRRDFAPVQPREKKKKKKKKKREVLSAR